MTGRITVVQVPNLPLAVFLAAVVIGHLLSGHRAASGAVAWVATGAIVIWALDEVVRGVNPWRRVLGTVVLVASIVSAVSR